MLMWCILTHGFMLNVLYFLSCNSNRGNAIRKDLQT